jgi:predicted nucleotidyltransferase
MDRILRLVLFGSAAKGDATLESDVDLIAGFDAAATT